MLPEQRQLSFARYSSRGPVPVWVARVAAWTLGL